MLFDFNIFGFFICFGLLLRLYIKILQRPEQSFLIDINWRDKLTIADIADGSADFWTVHMNEYKDKKQKRFCFENAHNAIKQSGDLKQFEALKVTIDDEQEPPENVIKLY